jgi:hypothetical protein
MIPSREQKTNNRRYVHCAFLSPFPGILSAMAILQQSRMDAVLHLGKSSKVSYTKPNQDQPPYAVKRDIQESEGTDESGLKRCLWKCCFWQPRNAEVQENRSPEYKCNRTNPPFRRRSPAAEVSHQIPDGGHGYQIKDFSQAEHAVSLQSRCIKGKSGSVYAIPELSQVEDVQVQSGKMRKDAIGAISKHPFHSVGPESQDCRHGCLSNAQRDWQFSVRHNSPQLVDTTQPGRRYLTFVQLVTVEIRPLHSEPRGSRCSVSDDTPGAGSVHPSKSMNRR